MNQEGSDYFPIEFLAQVDCLDFGRIKYHVVWIPEQAKASVGLEASGRLRVEAEIGEFGWHGAIMSAGQGQHYLILSSRCLRANAIRKGSEVEIRLRIVDPALVSTPPELAQALKVELEASEAWERLTPGHRRGLCHRVESARRSETRLARVKETLAFLVGRGPDPSKPRRPRQDGGSREEAAAATTQME